VDIGHPRSLLLLDLDGVVVLESPVDGRLELLRLHRDLAASILRFGCDVVVLTHRSAAEARTILRAAGLPLAGLRDVITAETILVEALRRGEIGTLLRRGLRKSLVLSVVEKRFGVERSRIAFIDDRVDNLDDLAAQGLGLAMLAPSHHFGASRMVTFEIAQAAEAFLAWTRVCVAGTRIHLPGVEVEVEPWRRSGLCTTVEGRSIFNRVRKIGGRARQRLFATTA
jgi:hypothetical protein